MKMMTTKPVLAAVLLAALAACSSTITRLDMPSVTSDRDLRALVGSVKVQTVSLPTYAATEEIALETAPGIITSDGELLWADDPQRGVTLQITRQLDDILTATVGPDPWPFAGLPDVTVDVRIAEMLGSVDGTFTLAGQYYIGGDGIDFRESSDDFNIVVAMATPDINAVAAAQATALLQLSEQIAGRLGR